MAPWLGRTPVFAYKQSGSIGPDLGQWAVPVYASRGVERGGGSGGGDGTEMCLG